MSVPPLLRHGDHVDPHYASGWAGRSTEAERPDGKATGIVRRFDRCVRADTVTMTHGLLAAVSDDAIRYTTPAASGLIGVVQIVGWAMLALGVWWFSFTSPTFLKELSIYPIRSILHLSLDALLSIACFVAWIWLMRLSLFHAIDQPTIFDRKHRKVYRLFSESQPGIKGLFKPWPLRACEYEWDLIDAEHNARIVTTGSTVRRQSHLMFIVRKSADDPTIIDGFSIGGELILDEVVASTYEHIRRFMEEGGPPVPAGEAPPRPRQRLRFWSKVWHFSPLNIKGYLWAWKQELPMMLLAHVLFPLTITFGLLWLFFNWLSVATSRPIEWPAEVVAAVGPEVAARQSVSSPG